MPLFRNRELNVQRIGHFFEVVDGVAGERDSGFDSLGYVASVRVAGVEDFAGSASLT